jgi:PASTA domain
VNDEEKVRVLVRQMHERVENTPWALRADDIRSQRRPRAVGISNPKVFGLVAAAIVIALLVVVLGTGGGSRGHNAHRVALPPTATTTAPSTTTTTAPDTSTTTNHGPTRVTVPELAGESQAQAQSVLAELGLSVGQIHLVAGASAAGTVLSQAPVAGSLIVPGSVVTLTVSSGPTTATTN